MNPWRLFVFGKFDLLDPAGRSVDFPNQRVREAFVLLSLHRQRGMDREAFAETLWPKATESQRRVSTRKCLSLLRKAIGSDNVEATRKTCRLAESLRLVSDIEDPSLRRSKCLSPAFDADWLDDYLLAPSPAASEEPSPADHFFEFTNFLGRHDCERALATMRENLSLCEALPVQRLRQLTLNLEACTGSPEWQTYFKGLVTIASSNIGAGHRTFRDTVCLAEKVRDLQLGVQAGVQLVLGSILTAKMDEARQYAEQILVFAKRSANPNLRATATQNLANVGVHQGDWNTAFNLYRDAEQLYTNPIDAHTIRAIRIFYETSIGRKSADGRALSETEAVARQSGHRMMQWFATASRANVAASRLTAEEALPALESSVLLADQIQNNQFSVFAHESLARGYVRAGMKLDAARSWRKASALRGSMSMRFTVWDAHRLGSERAILATLTA